jgi:hypothetical protein
MAFPCRRTLAGRSIRIRYVRVEEREWQSVALENDSIIADQFVELLDDGCHAFPGLVATSIEVAECLGGIGVQDVKAVPLNQHTRKVALRQAEYGEVVPAGQ